MGSFTLQEVAATNFQTIAGIEFVDLDVGHDGDRDIVALLRDSPNNVPYVVQLFENQGALQFAPKSFPLPADGPITDVRQVAACDVDDDGTDEWVLIGNLISESRITWATVTPNGLNGWMANPLPLGNSALGGGVPADWSASVGDVDGDGRDDLVLGNQPQARLLVLPRATTIGFEHATHFSGGGGVWRSLILDLEGDGRTDIVAPPGLTGPGTFSTVSDFVVFQQDCLGDVGIFGLGCPRSSGVVPHVRLSGCADVGSTVEVEASNVAGARLVAFLIGSGVDESSPKFGCVSYLTGVVPVPIFRFFPTGAPPIVSFGAEIRQVLQGTDLVLQAFVDDVVSMTGFATSNATIARVR